MFNSYCLDSGIPLVYSIDCILFSQFLKSHYQHCTVTLELRFWKGLSQTESFLSCLCLALCAAFWQTRAWSLHLVCCHLYLHVLCAAAECICVSIQWDMDEHGNLKIKPCLPTMLPFVGTNFPSWDNSQLNQRLALSTLSFVNLGVCKTLCQLLANRSLICFMLCY